MTGQLPTLQQMKDAWWYYTPELEDGTVMKGIYPDNLPFLPRLLQRQVELKGARCLDIGPAEGILPILAGKQGASLVVAAEHSTSIFTDKLHYLQNLHGTDVKLEFIGRAQNVAKLAEKYPEGFDYINLSGMLYHVTSPIDTVAAARRLLRPGGVMLVSTPIIVSRDCFMEFNDAGRLQVEPNTYWYISIGMMDYMLRLLRLKPVDIGYLGDQADRSKIQPDTWFGTVSVLCEAQTYPVAAPDDAWMAKCSASAWELEEYHAPPFPGEGAPAKVRAVSEGLVLDEGTGAVDLYQTILAWGSHGPAAGPDDTRLFRRVAMD